MNIVSAIFADPAVTNAVVMVVGSVATWAVGTIGATLKRRYNVQIDASLNDALLAAVDRATRAALAKGLSKDAIPSIVAGAILANRPDTAKHFRLDTATGAEKLRGIVADTLARVE